MSTLGFGVIGCGRMGKRRMTSVEEHAEANLVAVFDSESVLAKETAEEFKVDDASSWAELVDRDDVDCVIISVPNFFHREMAEHALAAGKHVFCEKPLAPTPEDAAAMVQAAEKSSATLTLGSNLRHFPSIVKASELLSEGAIGETVFLRTWIGHQGWNLGDTWFANPDLAGGGTYLDNGCHVFDITRWFLGEVVSCVGTVQTSVHDIAPLEDVGMGIFKTADGKTAYIQSSWCEWNGYHYLEVYGKEGYIRVDNRGRTCITTLGNTKGEETVFDFSDVPANSYKIEFSIFIDMLNKGEQAKPSGFDGMRAVQMAFGVYESAKAGSEIKIPKDFTGPA